jgi:hypothetical protein
VVKSPELSVRLRLIGISAIAGVAGQVLMVIVVTAQHLIEAVAAERDG